METLPFLTISLWIISLILAITLHEASHGFVAERFGDDTARKEGRVTFNPIKHVDPVGTLILPGLLLLMQSPVMFGYAKPVPVDFSRLKPERLGMLMVAIAGPAMNIFLALLSAILLHFGTPSPTPSWWEQGLYNAILVNSILALFNMIPILPLDGGRVLRALLPGKLGEAYARTERYGMLLVMALLLVPALLGLTFVTGTLLKANEMLVKAILLMAGH